MKQGSWPTLPTFFDERWDFEDLSHPTKTKDSSGGNLALTKIGRERLKLVKLANFKSAETL